jgi:hypothetical protein
MDELESLTSEYEIDLEKEVEKEEEFKNQFYDGLEDEEELFKTKKVKESINPDEDDEDLNNYIDEIDGDKFASLPTEEEESSKLTEPSKIKPILQPLAPVKNSEVTEVDVEIKDILKVSYLDFLGQEIGESKEMYKMREKITHLLAKSEIPRGKINVGLDTSTIILVGRMITNKLWFGMKYNKDQEALISALLEYIPEIKV